MVFFDDVEDLSVDGGADWQMVTLLVGKERRGFQAHLKRLGPLAAELKPSPGDKVELPEWDADVFNLVMNWTYNTALPRTGEKAACFPNSEWSMLPPDLSRPEADQFSPHQVPEDTTLHFVNVTAKPEYLTFSVEELRLHFDPHVRARQRKQEVGAQADKPPDKKEMVVHEGIQHERPKPESGETSRRSSIASSATEDEEVVKAEKGQFLLLKLMIFAEDYKWEQLFNDAIDAFSHGESHLRPLHTPTHYIDLAFSHSPPPTAVRRYILDYAIALGSRHNTMSKYQDAILSHPEILATMLSRMDLGAPGAFGLRPVGDPNDPSDQTDPTTDTYHIHDGRYVIYRGRDPVFWTKITELPLWNV
ncbi:hypothetical protein F5Y14DRAFT_240422 [Nemania sp. NC0429]|nr:hypothetical protein F5Y14DRAFT_240422 [Nemania sp. NC0429]